jgi:transposase
MCAASIRRSLLPIDALVLLHLLSRHATAMIPPRSNRKTPIEYDHEAYKRRNLIERCVNCLKKFRRIATRYEKTARAYLSILGIAAARLWIKTVRVCPES